MSPKGGVPLRKRSCVSDGTGTMSAAQSKYPDRSISRLLRRAGNKALWKHKERRGDVLTSRSREGDRLSVKRSWIEPRCERPTVTRYRRIFLTVSGSASANRI
jgi:hypothetical protein